MVFIKKKYLLWNIILLNSVCLAERTRISNQQQEEVEYTEIVEHDVACDTQDCPKDDNECKKIHYRRYTANDRQWQYNYARRPGFYNSVGLGGFGRWW